MIAVCFSESLTPIAVYRPNSVFHLILQLQFYMKGPSGTGQVHADMHKDTGGQWQYTYLLMDVYTGNSQTPSRVHIVSPK